MVIDLVELRKLCDTATPGPWKACSNILRGCASVRTGKEDILDFVQPLDGETADTARFIAASRTATPMLIDVAIAAKDWAIECRDDLGHDKMNLTFLIQALTKLLGDREEW